MTTMTKNPERKRETADVESLSFIANNSKSMDETKKTLDGKTTETGRNDVIEIPLPPKQYMIFFMGATTVLFVTCLVILFQPRPMALNKSVSSALLSSDNASDSLSSSISDDSSSFLSWSPFPHKPTDASVSYTSYATKDDGVVFKREFSIPCNDGVLVFNIGPAPVDQKYEFEIYDDAYIWSNNDDMCFLYPHYNAYQLGSEPFWENTDPSYVRMSHVNPTKVNRISTKVNRQPNSKSVDSDIRAKGGDYAIVGRGKFWSPHYWDGLREQVHNWKKDTDIQQALEEWATAAAATLSSALEE